MKRRTVLQAGATLAAAGLLAACSDSSATGGSTTTQPSVTPTAKLDGVSLTFWTAQGSATEAKQVIDAFQTATGAKVSTQVIPDPFESNVPTRLAGGDKPDLLFWQPTQSTLPFIQPQTNLLTLDDEPWVSTLGPTESKLGQVGGVRYAAVVTVPALLGVYYNKAVFAKAGITKPPVGYQQLLAAARTIRAKVPGVAPFFEVGGDKWPLQWQPQLQMSSLPQSFWDSLNKNTAKWTDPAIVAAITTYKTQVLDAGLAQSTYKTATFVDQGLDIMSGKAAMAVNVTALLSEIQAKNDTATIDRTIGWFPVSATSATGLYSPDQTNGVVAFKTGDDARQNASRQFLAFWLGTDYPAFIKAANVPSVQPAVPSPAGIPQIARDQLKALDTAQGVFQVKALNAPDMHLALADMIFGKDTPEQVAQACQAQFAQVAKAQGATGF